MEDLEDRIKRHEGLRFKPYVDTTGNTTIGYGHNLSENGITTYEADTLFMDDLQQAMIGYDFLPDGVIFKCNKVRGGVLTEMCFQLGYNGVSKFKKMLAAIEVEDFNEAANQMIDSKWARQTPNRAHELAGIMRKGE